MAAIGDYLYELIDCWDGYDQGQGERYAVALWKVEKLTERYCWVRGTYLISDTRRLRQLSRAALEERGQDELDHGTSYMRALHVKPGVDWPTFVVSDQRGNVIER
jgi:hypothetical protein